MRPDIKIGTSGWTYPHWKGPFYPEKQAKSKWLEYYAEHFDTVELNATFYRLPKIETFEKWRQRTPASFLWSLKASRYLTHVRRLKDPEEPLNRFYDAVKGLGTKLGPILFQLPPGLNFDPDLLQNFIEHLDTSRSHAIEVRHASWLNDIFFHSLETHNIAFCISDTAGRYPYSETVTADFVYIRLHGSKILYRSLYTEEELALWVEKIKGWKRKTFVYFDNDFEGYAVHNARRLKELFSS
jgi:uncharacterized protein YecE (DUF72 family)